MGASVIYVVPGRNEGHFLIGPMGHAYIIVRVPRKPHSSLRGISSYFLREMPLLSPICPINLHYPDVRRISVFATCQLRGSTPLSSMYHINLYGCSVWHIDFNKGVSEVYMSHGGNKEHFSMHPIRIDGFFRPCHVIHEL